MASYDIGTLRITWEDGIFPVDEDSLMRRFRAADGLDAAAEAVVYEPVIAPLSALATQHQVYSNDCTDAYDTENGRFIVCHWGTCRFGYGVYLDELLTCNRVRCYIDPAMHSQRPLDTITLFSTLGLHSKFLQNGGAVLHSSFVERGGEAILFAGPSGMGKSTQARLWEQYAQARVINGDRTLLMQKDGRWYAYGYPCCGSSGICLNESYPVRAIVLLAQGRESALCHLSAGRKVAALMAGMEAYSWEPREIERTFSLAQQIVQQVPVVLLSATTDENAVMILDRFLNG